MRERERQWDGELAVGSGVWQGVGYGRSGICRAVSFASSLDLIFFLRFSSCCCRNWALLLAYTHGLRFGFGWGWGCGVWAHGKITSAR